MATLLQLVKRNQSIGGSLIKRLDEDLIWTIGFLVWQGHSDAEIARCLNIPSSTFSRWKYKHKKLAKLIKKNRAWAFQEHQRVTIHRLNTEFDRLSHGRSLKYQMLIGMKAFKPRGPRRGRVNPNRNKVTGRFTSYPKVSFNLPHISKSVHLGGSTVEFEKTDERFPDYEPDKPGFGVW